jgi:tyrosyl-tRNA synthetase
LIGDPSGKSKTRKQLTRKDVERNVKAVSEQFYKILDPEKTEIYYNKDWLGQMQFEDVIKLASRYTVARILERDDFTNRLKEQKPIAMHEILYPLCQGMDSVHLDADVEIGGNDQKFNNLVGRTLMTQYKQTPQVVLLCPLLVGTDGTEKMSQSLGNYVSILDTPNDMFGRTMSIPDDLILNWFELCTDVPMDEAKAIENPRDAKVRLAKEIVALYHSVEAADEAERYFVETFSKRKQPVDAEEATIPNQVVEDGAAGIAQLLVALELVESNGKARNLIKQGAVSVDGTKFTDPFGKMSVADLDGKILKAGKHKFRKLVAG